MTSKINASTPIPNTKTSASSSSSSSKPETTSSTSTQNEESRAQNNSKLENLYITLSQSTYDVPFLLLILLFESILCILIIQNVSYTEIDWQAYMEEVSTYLEGERNYVNIKGGTGPLVYPAGFLYLYQFLRFVCGGDGSNVRTAQYLFGVLYVANTAVVLRLYSIVGRRMCNVVDEILTDAPVRTHCDRTQSKVIAHVAWTWRVAMGVCCCSKRVHSIFVLRLFNDAPAMFFCYLAIMCFVKDWWRVGCFWYSMGVGIKMNVLLFAPGLLLLLLQACGGVGEVVVCLGVCAVVQVVLGGPFLMTFPVSYLRKAFELDRVFFYKWTVNWKFLPENIFTSKPLSIMLLLIHIEFLVVFAMKWLRSAKDQTGSYLFLCHDDKHQNNNTHDPNNTTSTTTTTTSSSRRTKHQLTPEYILQTLFVSNFIGIVFARTLHYQFYSWYFHTVPFMLMFTLMKKPIKLMVVVGIEYAFNVFPATAQSSAVLQMSHFVLLFGVIMAGVPQILYVKSDGLKQD